MEDGDQSPGPEEPSRVTPESFYDEYVRHHVPYHRNPRGLKGLILRVLPYWSYREWRFWRRYVPRGGLLLDLGCARGREIFAERADRTVGLDIAHEALRDCGRHYSFAVRSRLDPLPLADRSVDCVVTSHVLGHIPLDEKDNLIAEIMRVLKPGAGSLHWIETDSNHPLVSWAKESPSLYRKAFIAPDGHVGLEMGREVIERFERHGFRVLRVVGSDSGPFHPRLMLKHFDNDYRKASRRIDRRVRWSRRVMEMPIALAVIEVLLGLHHFTFARLASAQVKAQFIGLVLEKPTSDR